MGPRRRFRIQPGFSVCRFEALESRVLLSGTGAVRPLPREVGGNLASVFLSESTDQAAAGTAVNFVAHVVSSQSADGCVVDFVDNTAARAVVIGSGTVRNGAASFSWGNGLAGAHQITAQLEAGQVVAGMPSAAQFVTISKGATSTGLVQVGATLVATVSVGDLPASGGTVSFFEGTTLLGTVGVKGDGAAVFSLASLKAGAHAIVAAFNGTSQLLPSTSTELVVVMGGSSRGGGSHAGIVPHGRGHWALPMVVERPAARKQVKHPAVVKHKK